MSKTYSFAKSCYCITFFLGNGNFWVTTLIWVLKNLYPRNLPYLFLNFHLFSIVSKLVVGGIIVVHVIKFWLDVAYHEQTLAEHTFNMCLVNLLRLWKMKVTFIMEKDTRKKSDRTLLVITCNRFLPNITKTITKNWNTLHINENLK